ncbi:MAG TPA: KpsF/GutQ family sugar-phosphate isomerase [Gemmatimonadaceae bacterium]|nr:KpsF/GutQ family sugar-phosphate isomerase [Gemmatimonadaceae bacterium]
MTKTSAPSRASAPPTTAAGDDEAARADAIIARGRRVLRMERGAIEEVEGRLGNEFARAVLLIQHSPGRVIVSGVGKSGLIGRKIAATLTSTGTPASFLHPVEGLHGDLGIVGDDDVAILISKSGESAELLPLLDHLKRQGVHTIALIGEPESTLARSSDVALDARVREEACPHDLAPTTSTTAALAIGDALAVALLEEKGFRREDFARLHPGGSLGRRLLMRVTDVMLTDDLPLMRPDDTMFDGMMLLAERRGIVVVVDDDRHVLGVVTSGDFARLVERERDDLREVAGVRMRDVMTRSPKVARASELASAVVYTMNQSKIMAMPVVSDDDLRVVGIVHLHDLNRAGVA